MKRDYVLKRIHNIYPCLRLDISEVQNNARTRVDVEFLFECSTRFLTSERSER